ISHSASWQDPLEMMRWIGPEWKRGDTWSRRIRMGRGLLTHQQQTGFFAASFQGTSGSCLVTIAEGKHRYPFRTPQLSPPAPMVLGAGAPGRVGRCQAADWFPQKAHDTCRVMGFLFLCRDLLLRFKRQLFQVIV